MKQLFYEKVTIENIQSLIKTGYVTEIVCDGDNKTINIGADDLLKIEQIFKEIVNSLQPVAEAIVELGRKMCNSFNLIWKDINCLLYKKMTKKKFMKLLQSKGIQRNKINLILKDNTEPYTYARYYKLIENVKR